MPLLGQPRIHLLAPPEIVPGERILLEVVLSVRRATTLELLDAELTSTESVALFDGSHTASRHEQVVLRLRARLLQKTRLPPGTRRFQCAIDLPLETPPTYVGRRASCKHALTVHASIPWWFDARATFVLNVARTSKPQPEPKSYIAATSREGPLGGEPYMEVSLSNIHVRPGEVLDGAVALFNLGPAKFHALDIALVGYEESHLRQTNEPAHNYALTRPLQGVIEGDSIPLRFRVPHVPPTTSTFSWRLRWALHVIARRRWGANLAAAIPIVISPHTHQVPAENPKPRMLAPTVGSLRIEEVWKQVAARHQMDLAGDRLHKRVGEVDVVVQRERQGRRGVHLVGTLTFPNLHLNLRGGRATGSWQHWGSRSSVSLRKGKVFLTGREISQVTAFCEHLELDSVDARVVDLSDEHLVLQFPHAGHLFERVERFARVMISLAQRHPGAVRAIPPPAAFSNTAVAEWKRLAHHLGGQLETARMAVHGSYEEHPAHVVTEWNAVGNMQGTHIEVELLRRLSEDTSIRWNADAGEIAGDIAALRGQRRVLVDSITSSARGLEVAPERLRVTVGAPMRAPHEAADWLRRLVDLEEALQRKRQPYR